MNWRAALYGRVSTEHEEQQESIKVQQDALTQYAVENNYEIIKCYFDEGFTGTNFERPGISFLKKDIENGNINLILVKDLSRIGRNNPLTLLFLDYLIQNDIRLIAVNDDYDNFKDEDDIIGIKTWFNERYSKELSKKIKFALNHKKKNGEYITPFPPYGYVKSKVKKNKLEIDYYAASVVKEIFNLYIAGMGFSKITQVLESKEILNPSRYSRYSKMSSKWDWTMIRKIITNEVYTGCSIQQKYCKKSFKNKKMSKTDPNEWIRVENTHEALISREIYNLANDILNRRKTKFKYRCGPIKPHLFTSFIYCHECGSPLYFRKDKNRSIYKCGKYIKLGTKGCTSHSISEDELKEIVAGELKKVINNNIDLKLIIEKASQKLRSSENTEKTLIGLDEYIEKNLKKIEILYEDRLNCKIEEELFTKISKRINSNTEKLKKQKLDILSQNKQQLSLEQKILSTIDFDNRIDRYLLELFIDKIEIFNNCNIIINFNFKL